MLREELRRNQRRQRFCKYPECHNKRDNRTHTLLTCPRLFARCLRCGARGHEADSFKCDPADKKSMEAARTLFEGYASSHKYAKMRAIVPGLGFYPLEAPPVEGAAAPFEYAYLQSLPVLKACNLTNPGKYPA